MVWITSNTGFWDHSTQVESPMMRVMISLMNPSIEDPFFSRPLLVIFLVLAGLKQVGSPPRGVSVYEVIGGLFNPIMCP